MGRSHAALQRMTDEEDRGGYRALLAFSQWRGTAGTLPCILLPVQPFPSSRFCGMLRRIRERGSAHSGGSAMTFEEILAHVLAVLQREKRVSYRALKRRFALDDEYLDDIKDELIYAKKLAVDEENRVLVWIGHVEGIANTASPPDTTSQQPPQITPPRPEPHTPEAERRQLTVMFCDLVDSTALSGQLDPEDLRTIVHAYQKVCSDVIARFDGHIAQLLGDGLLVYFGYPQAHEDDAQRAVRTGLGILDAMGDLNTRLQRDKGLQLAIRLGIHTGLVVGAMGGAGRQEQLALGEVPNIASRIEGLAAPNTMAVSEATSRLVQGFFDCQDLGAQTLRG